VGVVHRQHQRTIDTKVEHGVFSAAFSPDGKLIAGAVLGDGSARVWDVETGELKHTLKDYKAKAGLIQIVQFLPDGTLVTCGASEKNDGNLKLWDMKTGKLIKAIADPNLGVRSMDITRDGKTIAVGTWEKTLVIVPIGK
jgi:WD40 repeat protein